MLALIVGSKFSQLNKNDESPKTAQQLIAILR